MTNRAQGIDVSKWQQQLLPWTTISKDYSFVFIRASVGVDKDPMYEEHLSGALASGMLVGAYHYLWGSADPIQQAALFVESIGDRRRLLLPHVADVESSSLNEAKVKAFVDEVFRLTGVRCIIYTRKNLWERYIGQNIAWARQHPLWVAQYIDREDPNAIPDSWDTWDFWQFGAVDIQGYPSDLDGNVYNGTLDDLKRRFLLKFKLRWPTDYMTVTQAFGARPEYYSQFKVDGVPLPGHEGIDIKAPFGSNVYACASGIVYSVREADGNPYGVHVRIDHENGYKTVYAHLHRPLVRVGDRVEEGQTIGLADTTGNSQGSHLHLTLKKDGATAVGETNYPGDIMDPTPYFDVTEEETGDILLETIIGSGLYMRKGPGTLYASVYTIQQGERVIALDEPGIVDCLVGKQEHWLKVKSRTGVVGWSAAWYLKKV